MISKFRDYLEREYKGLPATKETMESREESLSFLLDKAQEYRIKGMTDEDAIYELCIDALGDVKKTLREKEQKKIKEEKIKNKISVVAVLITSIVLFITAAYLITSFITEMWSKTWLIMVGGIFIGLIGVSAFGIVKAAQAQKHMIARLLTALIITLVSVFVFLVLQILFKINGSWMTFLVMAILIVGTDTAISYASKNATFFPELLIFIAESASLIYVILGITKVVSWHPYWLIAAVAVMLDIMLAVAGAVIFFKKKKELLRAEEKMRGDRIQWEERPEDKISSKK